MFRQVLENGLKTPTVLWQSVAKYQNFVMNDSLAQLEKQCERYCRVPRFPPRKVAVLGAGSDVGRIACLFLKQQRIIRILSMYDDEPERNVLGAASDIAHIDTSPAVQAFQGRMYLKDALHGANEQTYRLMVSDYRRPWTPATPEDADVVLICGGNYILPPCCNMLDRDLFFENMSFVRTVTIASAQFAPHAIIAVQSPPVDANFALVKHTMKIAKLYNKRKVLGVNSINAMRANQLFSAAVGRNPASSNLPVVCGTGKCTRVPCFSSGGDKSNISEKKAKDLTRLVREADELICKVKSNNEQGHLSIGFATARFVTNLMLGLFQRPAYIDSALVDQGNPSACYNMKTCATPVTVGKGGIVEYIIPKLNGFESKLLEESKCDLEDMLNLGRCYATGDEYYLHPLKTPYFLNKPNCPVVTPC